jgi:hypothetical protein
MMPGETFRAVAANHYLAAVLLDHGAGYALVLLESIELIVIGCALDDY